MKEIAGVKGNVFFLWSHVEEVPFEGSHWRTPSSISLSPFVPCGGRGEISLTGRRNRACLAQAFLVRVSLPTECMNSCTFCTLTLSSLERLPCGRDLRQVSTTRDQMGSTD